MFWPMRSRLTILLYIGGILVCLSRPIVARQENPRSGSAPFLLWKSDLTALGATHLSEWKKGKGEGSWWPMVRGVEFVTSDMLIVHFVKHELGVGLPQRDELSASSPYLLVATFFDASLGTQRSTMSWPTFPSSQSRIYPLGDGRFLTLTGNLLSVYSSTREKLREYRIPLTSSAKADKPDHTYFDAYVSPDGETVLAGAWGNDDNRHTLLRTETLQPLSEWKGEQHLISFYGDQLVWSEGYEIWMKTPTTQPRLLYRTARQIEEVPAFVDRNTLAVVEGTGKTSGILEFISLDGRSLLTEEFKGQDLFVVALNSSRSYKQGWTPGARVFAVPVVTYRRSHFDAGLDFQHLRVAIYDISSRKRLALLDPDPKSKCFYDFAVSPDGRLLAVLCDTLLSVYRIPSGD